MRWKILGSFINYMHMNSVTSLIKSADIMPAVNSKRMSSEWKLCMANWLFRLKINLLGYPALYFHETMFVSIKDAVLVQQTQRTRQHSWRVILTSFNNTFVGISSLVKLNRYFLCRILNLNIYELYLVPVFSRSHILRHCVVINLQYWTG